MTTQRRLWIYITALVVALLAMFVLSEYRYGSRGQQGSAEPSLRDWPQVHASGELRLIAPYDYVAQAGDNSTKLLTLLQKHSGLQVKLYLEDNISRSIQRLLSGEVDFILAPVERSSFMDSTQLLWVTEEVSAPIYLVQRDDSLRVNRHTELDGKTIVIPRGSSSRLFIGHLSEELGIDLQISEDSLYNTEQLVIKVQAGSIDYTLCRGDQVQAYRARFADLDFSLPMSHALRRGWITRRQAPQLADSLKSWLISVSSLY